MKTLSTISAAAVFATMFTIPAWAGSVGISRNYPTVQPDQTTLAELEDASQAANRQARQHRNNLEFQRKSYEIDQLIEQIKAGQQVDPAELNKAMEPAHVW
jgi:hypothetical protein